MDAKGTRKNIDIVDSISHGGVKAEVLEYTTLKGLTDMTMAQRMYYMGQQNMRVRQVALYIENDSCKIEPGAMSYFQGELEMISGVTAGKFVGRMITGALTGEAVAQPEYKGTGMLVLEPTFRHIILATLNEGDSVIVDKGMFYAAQGSVGVKAVMQKNISSGIAGGEGWFQVELTGPGVIVMESEVPFDEIDVINIQNDTLKVDGNFAVLRSGNINFTVERSAKTLLGSAVSGEGLVNVFRGTGQVWLAPTIKVYDTLAYGGTDIRSMNMNTSTSKKNR